MKRIVLMANGELYEPAYIQSLLRPDDWIIVANGGTRHAWTLQRVPQLLVGDSDSLPAPLQRWLASEAVPRHDHPRDKDATDLELAFEHAVSLAPPALLLLGVTGGRVDHTVANLSLLARAKAAGVQAEIVVGYEHLHLLYHQLTLQGSPGQTVSLLPLGGDAVGVTTRGLRWALHEATLPFGSTRGISNILAGAEAQISLRDGLLLVSHHQKPL